MANQIENLVFTKVKYPDVLEVANQLADLEERRPHDSITRLILDAGKNRIAKLEQEKKNTEQVKV